jgi:starvation-inducible DNA-binding protein
MKAPQSKASGDEEYMNATPNNPPGSARKPSADILNSVAADLFYLYARTKQARWRVRGPSSFALHKLLDEFATTLQDYVDAAAEHIDASGGDVETTLGEPLRPARLEQSEDFVLQSGECDWIAELADAHTAVVERVRAALKWLTAEKDIGTAVLLTDLLRDLDKQRWILEAQVGWRHSDIYHREPAFTH